MQAQQRKKDKTNLERRINKKKPRIVQAVGTVGQRKTQQQNIVL